MSVWSLVGARQTSNGKWAVTWSRPADPTTPIGELVAGLAETTPRAFTAVISIDLRRQDRAVTAVVYASSAEEAKTLMSEHRGPAMFHES